RPHVDTIRNSGHPNMKELLVQPAGRPYRILFAFDPRRSAILLIGGDKTGRDRWYEEYVPRADRLYDQHLETLRREDRARRRKERSWLSRSGCFARRCRRSPSDAPLRRPTR